MFDLHIAIAQWRNQMSHGGLKSPELLDELESHLRDEFDAQVDSGASPQDAFNRAVAAVGPAAELNAEFVKVTATTERMTKFLQASYSVVAVFMLFVNTWTLLEYELSPVARSVGIIGVLLTSLYVAAIPRWLRYWPAAYFRRLAGLMKAAAHLVWVWPLLALLDAEHIIGIQLGIVSIVFIWCCYAAIVMTAIAFPLFQKGRSGGTDGWPPPHQIPRPIPPTSGSAPEISLPGARTSDASTHLALEYARDEASRWGHSYIGTEHLLLGILKPAKGKLANILHQINLEYDAVQTEMERLITAAPAAASTNPIPLTPRAKKALRVAAREAKAMKNPGLAAEHILLGLLLEGSGLGARVLRNLGVKEQTIRDAIGR